MQATAFLRSGSARGLTVLALCCLALAVAVGTGFFYAGAAAFKRNKEEAALALAQVDAFVVTSSTVRSALPGDAPVSATFRAHVIEALNAGGDGLRIRLVGLPDRERWSAPADPSFAAAAREIGQAPSRPLTDFTEIGGEPVLRTVVASVASQPGCIDCHNRAAEPSSWRLGDVMGAVVVDVPARAFLQANRGQALLLGCAAFAICFAIGFPLFRRHARGLKEEAETAARASLSETRQRFLHAIENLSDGIAMWDAEDRFVLCNAIYLQLSGAASDRLAPGYTFEDYIRRSVEVGEITMPQKEREAWIAGRLRRHQAGAGAFEIFRFGRWLLIREIRTPDGGTVISATDISDLKAREREIHGARAAAEAASRAKSEFLANMSHELRTPLNAVIGFSEVMKGAMLGPIGNPKYLEYAADIHASGTHLLAIINDILDLAKVEAGRLTLEDTVFDADAAVEEALRTVTPQAGAAGVDLAPPPPTGIAGLRGDPRAFRQVLLNLLSNAVKFTPAGGRVEVLVRRVPGEDLEIAVADTGIGIAPEHLELVLQPFGQVEGALSRSTGGTGLGLPIAKSLIEQFGGGLTVESQPGRGTTVTLRLPAARVLESGAGAATDEASRRTAGEPRRNTGAST